MDMIPVINELRIRRDILLEAVMVSQASIAEMENNSADVEIIEEQKELLSDRKFRLRGITKAIQGLRDYVDGGLTD